MQTYTHHSCQLGGHFAKAIHARAHTHTLTHTHTHTNKHTHTHTVLRSHSLTLSRTHSHTHKQAAKGSAPTSHTRSTSHSLALSHPIYLSHSPFSLSSLALSHSRALTLSRARTLAHTNKQPRGGQASVALFSCTLFLCHSHSSVALAKETALSLSCTETPSVALSFSCTLLEFHSPFSPSSVAFLSRAPLSLSQQPAERSAAISRPVLSTTSLHLLYIFSTSSLHLNFRAITLLPAHSVARARSLTQKEPAKGSAPIWSKTSTVLLLPRCAA